MTLRDHCFRVELEQDGQEGWYTLAGVRRGPFASPAAAEADLLEVMARWKVRARTLGGWVWRRSWLEIVVTLPESVDVRGGEELASWVPKR